MKKRMHILYLVLFLASCAIVFISLYITNESWKTIIVSIGCGGIASVLIAWLIDWQNRRNIKVENELKFKKILKSYSYIYHRLILTTINECHGLYQINEKHSFKEWLMILSDENRYSQLSTPTMKKRCERISANLIEIQKYIENFEIQCVTLIMNDFPRIEEILKFFKAQHLHAEGSLILLKCGNYKEFCATTHILYKEFLDEFPQCKLEFADQYDSSLLKR